MSTLSDLKRQRLEIQARHDAKKAEVEAAARTRDARKREAEFAQEKLTKRAAERYEIEQELARNEGEQAVQRLTPALVEAIATDSLTHEQRYSLVRLGVMQRYSPHDPPTWTSLGWWVRRIVLERAQAKQEQQP